VKGEGEVSTSPSDDRRVASYNSSDGEGQLINSLNELLGRLRLLCLHFGLRYREKVE
jgi:hypothetical protein